MEVEGREKSGGGGGGRRKEKGWEERRGGGEGRKEERSEGERELLSMFLSGSRNSNVQYTIFTRIVYARTASTPDLGL